MYLNQLIQYIPPYPRSQSEAKYDGAEVVHRKRTQQVDSFLTEGVEMRNGKSSTDVSTAFLT